MIVTSILVIVSVFFCAVRVLSSEEGDDKNTREIRPSASHSLHSSPRASDLGSGTPNAQCATPRLGKSFQKNGKRYTCKGPKPYRWRLDEAKSTEATAPPPFSSCEEMRKYYPNGVPVGHHAYVRGLDRDRDGRACER